LVRLTISSRRSIIASLTSIFFIKNNLPGETLSGNG
jgi:hypothetical protein